MSKDPPTQYGMHSLLVYGQQTHNNTRLKTEKTYIYYMNQIKFKTWATITLLILCMKGPLWTYMYVSTFWPRLILAPASIRVFSKLWCPSRHTMNNGLRPSYNTNVIITRGLTSGGECWSITYDRCKHFCIREGKHV